MAIGKKYPEVLRISDPLLIRIDRHSLLVNDTTFWAKIKNGIQWKGFMVYVSGTNMPIYEDKKDVLESRDARSVEAYLKQEAENWIDALQEAILEKKNDNEIKRAIDRLCWQMHYDITDSNTDFTRAFSEQNFSDNMTVDVKSNNNGLLTIPETMTDSAHIITGGDSGGSSYGSLYDISSKLNTINSTVDTKIGTLNSNITSFDSHMNASGTGTLVTLNTSITTIDTHMNDSSSGTIVALSDKMNKVAINLKSDSDTYTISKALRDGSSEESVSGQLKLQTTEITNGLGSSGAINTSLTSIGTTTSDIKTSTSNINRSVGSIGDTANGSLVAYVTRVDSNISTIKTNTGTIDANIGTISTNTGTVVTKIGSGTGTSATVLGALDRIKYTLGGDASTTMWTNISDIGSYLNMSKVSISGGYTALMVANYPQS